MAYGTVVEVALILACVLLSGLFSGSETALTSLHAGRLEQLLSSNRPGLRLLRLWRDQPRTVLSFLLVANNLVNILASSLATQLSLKTLAGFGVDGAVGIAIALAVGVMTFLILVFGEVLPKTYARHNPHHVTSVLPLLLAFYALLWPVAKVLAYIGRGFISLAGGDPASPPPTITEEELEFLIQKGHKEGSLDEDKERMLSGVLSLEDRIAKEVMVPRTDMVMFEARANIGAVMDGITEHNFSRYPVYQESKDKVIGVFYAKDLLSYFIDKERKDAFKLRNFVRPPYFVPETKRLDELLGEFQEERIHISIVVDEYGGTAGMVTLEDIIEEMIGEIYDEFDKEEKLCIQVDESTFIVNSRVPVEELKEELELEIQFADDREYESLGGLVMELAGSVPGRGETFTYRGPNDDDPVLNLTVLESDGVKLGKVKLVVGPPESD